MISEIMLLIFKKWTKKYVQYKVAFSRYVFISHVKNLIAFHFPINQINWRPCRVKNVSQNLLDLSLISIFFYLEVWSPDTSRNA